MDRWSLVEIVRSRLEQEQGTLFKDAPLRVALCYPSTYHVGMSSLGFQTIYREIHAHEGATAERAFLPDDVAAARQAGVPLFTYETQTPVSQASVVAFSVAYELEITCLIEMLSLAGIPLLSSERTDAHPLVIAGGPLTFSNPAPLEPLVDLMIMGEAEQAVHVLLEAALAATNRAALLAQLADQPGFHVTGRGAPLPAILRASDASLPAYSQIITPNTELRSMFLVEAERGCSRGCAYCVMRRTTNGGMRVVDTKSVLGRIPPHAKKVGLVGAAATDHPQIEEMIRSLVESGREIGISSLRAERLTPSLLDLLARGGYRTLTVALDGASKRLRDRVDRQTSSEHLLHVAQLARQAQLKRLKVYVMIGLPEETEDDIDELAALVNEVARIIPVSLGISPLVAKRNTPLDGTPFEPMASQEAKLRYLRKKVRGMVEIRPTSSRWAYVEYMFAQGGPQAGLAAIDAWRNGGNFAAFKRAFASHGIRSD